MFEKKIFFLHSHSIQLRAGIPENIRNPLHRYSKSEKNILYQRHFDFRYLASLIDVLNWDMFHLPVWAAVPTLVQTNIIQNTIDSRKHYIMDTCPTRVSPVLNFFICSKIEEFNEANENKHNHEMQQVN